MVISTAAVSLQHSRWNTFFFIASLFSSLLSPSLFFFFFFFLFYLTAAAAVGVGDICNAILDCCCCCCCCRESLVVLWCGVKEIGHAIAVAACSGPVQFSNPRHVTASSVFFSYPFPFCNCCERKRGKLMRFVQTCYYYYYYYYYYEGDRLRRPYIENCT